MEIQKKCVFFTKFYGSAPAKAYENILVDYITGKQDKELLSFADQNKKKAQTIDQMVVDILSLFHRNGSKEPMVPSWAVRRCLIETGQSIFNAIKNKAHPKKTLIPMAIVAVEPYLIPVYRNNEVVKQPDGIDTYAVSIQRGAKSRSFFKAYEYINSGAEFTIKLTLDEDLINPELYDYWLEKAGLVGTGAFRERFGKFEVRDGI